MKRKLLGEYINGEGYGSYRVSLYDDGTRIMETLGDYNEFISSFPNSLDCKITNKCDKNPLCKYCHEDSTPDGLHGDIMNARFIDTLRPYTEIALGGGSIFTHPDLIPFLHKLRDRKIIANITINQQHFMENLDLLEELTREKLIYGIGVSFTQGKNDCLKIAAARFSNLVWHVINGVVDLDDLQWLTHPVKDANRNEKNKITYKNAKVLILGYKMLRRGREFYSKKVKNRQQELYNELSEVMKWCKVISFDNLALEQLEVKRLLTNEQWNQFYQGSDGESTLYVDLPNKTYGLSSTSPIKYKLADTIDEMLATVKKEIV